MSHKIFISIGFFLFFFAILVSIKTPTRSESLSCPDFNQASLAINQHSFNVALAATPTQHRKGLSGCGNVANDQGMYFPLPKKMVATFWMKKMYIPIDIIWISNNKIIGIEHNVPPPNNINDTNLPTYSPLEPIDAVLELPAGTSQKLNINIGDIIK